MLTVDKFKYRKLRELRSPAFKLYVFMLLNSEDGLFRMAQREMAVEAGMNLGSITHAIKLLEDCGFIEVVPQGGRQAYEYRLVGGSE